MRPLLANRYDIGVASSGINFLVEHESIRYNAVHYGYSFDYSCRPYRWGNREALDAGKRSWWFYRHDSARHRWRVHCHLPRPGPRLVQGRTTSGVDYVNRRCHDPVASLSVPFQAQTVVPQPVNKLRLLASVTLVCIATLFIAVATAKALTQEQESAKGKCGLEFANCINSTCAKYKGDDQNQMRCYERCVSIYTKCLEKAGIPIEANVSTIPAKPGGQ